MIIRQAAELTELDRMNWVCYYLGNNGNNKISMSYAAEFCKKILKGFDETGIIPINLLNYVSICSDSGYQAKELRKFLKDLGIRCRNYRIEDGHEFILRKEDYHLFRISISDDNVNFHDSSLDIDFDKMNKDYREQRGNGKL